MELRNCILIALAFDATAAEIEHAHNLIDKMYNNGQAADYVVTATVPGAINGVTAVAAQNANAAGTPNGVGSEAPQFDKNGLPWDERIHSSSKAITDKGVWRLKRGVSEALVKQVEAELRGVTAATGTPAPTATPPVNAQPQLPGTGPALPGTGLPPLPGANAAPALDPAYTAFVEFIAQNTNSPANPNGRLTDDFVKQVLAYYQVPEGNLQNLAHNTALIPQIEAYIRAQLGG